MSPNEQLPSHPFWEYSLRLYARPGVAPACLRLQDEFDLDVNLVLFCLWAGAEGPGVLGAEELQKCIVQGGLWQREVVRPLREIRRRLKTEPLGAPEQLAAMFRPQVQSLEIEAEHVQQLVLAEIVPAKRGATGAEVAAHNMDAYIEAAGLVPTGLLQDQVQVIFQAAFPAQGAGK